MKRQMIIATLVALAAILGGCQKTAQGIGADTERNAENVSESVAEGMDRAGEAGQDVSAATGLTPRIKAAITADRQLNEATNSINVESTAETVVLVGYVTSEELKRRAQEVAEKEIKDAGSTQQVVNRLEVRKS